MSIQTLKAHLSAMGCFFEEMPEQGTLHWDASEDLFGDGHRIQISWTLLSWEASRIWMSNEGSQKTKMVWKFKAEKNPNGRFRLKEKEGPVLLQIEKEGVSVKSIVEACRWIKKEIHELNAEPPKLAKKLSV